MTAEGAAWWSLIALTAGGMLIYFLPAIVAFTRRHRQRGAILLLDLFLGWSLLGWVIALVWAATSDVEARPAAGDRRAVR